MRGRITGRELQRRGRSAVIVRAKFALFHLAVVLTHAGMSWQYAIRW